MALTALMGAALLIGAATFFAPAMDGSPDRSQALPSVLETTIESRTARMRLAAWKAGIEGFAERPLFGWGPENFAVVFARFADDLPPRTRSHDYAHGELVEALATMGIVGALCYLGLWGSALLRLQSTARGQDVR